VLWHLESCVASYVQLLGFCGCLKPFTTSCARLAGLTCAARSELCIVRIGEKDRRDMAAEDYGESSMNDWKKSYLQHFWRTKK
jgi:hypothetical protein